MFRVVTCITQQHDVRLVLLAAVVCMIACYTTLRMLARATDVPAGVAPIWCCGAGIAFGSGVWATHFVAMLAYAPELRAHFDGGASVLSLGVAIAGSAITFVLLHGRTGAGSRLLAGLFLGGFVAAMHYIGMAALIVPALLFYDPVLVAVSVIIGMVLPAAALVLAGKAPLWCRSLLLVLAICGLHFTAMAAVDVLPYPGGTVDAAAIEPGSLALAVAAVSLLILLLSLAGSVIDQHLARRTASEAARLRQFADASFEGIIFHRGGEIVDVNAVICALRGCGPEALVGRPVDELFVGSLHASVGAQADDAAWEASFLAVGRELPVELHRRTISEHGASLEVLVVRDLSARKEAERQIARLAHFDALTGLPNRFLFQDRAAQALAAGERAGSRVAILYLDLDRFKLVNDVLGHPIGDALLQQVALRMAESTREIDTAARLGGDEFVVLQPGTTQQGAAALATRLIARLGQPYMIDGHEVNIGVTIGIGICPDDGRTLAVLLKNADLALYRAKRDGRGQFCFFEPEMDVELRRRRTLEQDLRQALADGALDVHYQPLFSGENLALEGYEALVRWNHPVQGNISPADFIPLAEECGLIAPLGQWVLETACREAASWDAPRRIAVNVSPAQIKQTDLCAIVADILARTGLAPQRLELEVTEGILIEDTGRALDVLNGLKAIGVRIVLDDFGTGYSSLSYLQRFSFDKIKIDRSFVQSIGNDAADAIVRSIVALSHSLQLSVTAEGVETAEQLDQLRAHNCDQIQGFLLGRPMALRAGTRLTLATPAVHVETAA